MASERFPTCGSSVRVQSSDEGTSHYVPASEQTEARGDWGDVVTLLDEAAALADRATEIATRQLATQPNHDRSRGKRDPRRSMIEAAQFVSHMSYQSGSLKRVADRVRDPAPTQTRGDGEEGR